MRLEPSAVYIGDNGRTFCGQHAGYTAQTTGRDLSGQRIMKLTTLDIAYLRTLGATGECEQCRCAKAAS